jgi:hypothetical protein
MCRRGGFGKFVNTATFAENSGQVCAEPTLILKIKTLLNDVLDAGIGLIP